MPRAEMEPPASDIGEGVSAGASGAQSGERQAEPRPAGRDPTGSVDMDEDEDEDGDEGLGITDVDGGDDDAGMDGEEEELAKMHQAAEYEYGKGAAGVMMGQQGSVSPGIDIEPTPAIFTSNDNRRVFIVDEIIRAQGAHRPSFEFYGYIVAINPDLASSSQDAAEQDPGMGAEVVASGLTLSLRYEPPSPKFRSKCPGFASYRLKVSRGMEFLYSMRGLPQQLWVDNAALLAVWGKLELAFGSPQELMHFLETIRYVDVGERQLIWGPALDSLDACGRDEEDADSIPVSVVGSFPGYPYQLQRPSSAPPRPSRRPDEVSPRARASDKGIVRSSKTRTSISMADPSPLQPPGGPGDLNTAATPASIDHQPQPYIPYYTSSYPRTRPGLLYGLGALEDASPGASYALVALGAAAAGFSLGFLCRSSAR